MPKYALTKLLLFFPISFLIGLAVFLISELAPGDRVNAYLDIFGSRSSEKSELARVDYIKTAKLLNLEKPQFYFSIVPNGYPENFSKIVIPIQKEMILSLLNENIDKIEAEELIEKMFKYENNVDSENKSSGDLYFKINNGLKEIYHSETRGEMIENIDVFLNDQSLSENNNDEITYLIKLLESLKNSGIEKSFSDKIPVIRYNGMENRFHIWFKKILHFDFGISYVDGRPVRKKIGEALPFTLIYVVLAYIFSLLISIPFALYGNLKEKSICYRIVNACLTLFYAMPLFWLATLAVIFLTSGEVFSFLNIFPSIGVGRIIADMSSFEKIRTAMPHLLLPALILAFHSGSYLTMLISRSLKKEKENQYFKGLITRGIDYKNAVIKHAFPNSLLPLITAIVVGLPGSIAGSVVIEVIFNIPGMGRLLYNSLLKMDWNVVFAIVMIIGVLTYIFYIMGDLIYYWLNPKMKLN